MRQGVRIETFLRIADGTFVPIGEVDVYAGDPRHMEGAIVMTLDGREVLSLELWDDVDMLWPFVVQALDECLTWGLGERFFPDQPIRFQVERMSDDQLSVSVSGGRTDNLGTAQRSEFVNAIASAAAEFFRHLERLIPGSDVIVEPEMARIRSWSSADDQT
jgi:hypothetical protein